MIRCVDGIWYDALIYEGIASVVACVDNENLGVGPKTYEGDIVIPDSFNVGGNEYRVMGIDEGAFSGCTGLTSVTIPSVERIGSDAFSGCTGLTSVTIPSVERIGSGVFSGCTGLTSVTISEGVTNIGSSAFEGCTSLTSVTIPNSVTTIGGNAFSGCTGLTSVTISEGVTDIGSSTFEGCTSLTSVQIPSSVTTIGEKAFENTFWYNNQPDGLFYINDVAYKYKGEMPEGTSITLREGTVSISSSAFSGCIGMTSVTIPSSVTSIGGSAFSGCTGMTSVTIPNSVTTIDCSAFEDCSGLTSVTIPISVTTIGNYAFSGCTGLTSVTIPSSVTGIGDDAFGGCTGLTSVTIPNSVTWIGARAFSCRNLLSIYVESETPAFIYPDYEEGGPMYTFYSVNKSSCVLYVPKGSKSAFENAEGWKDFQNIVEVLDTGPCGENVTFTLYSDMTMVISGTGTMDNYPSLPTEYYREIEKVIIEDGVTSICGMAFYKYRGMTSVTIPNSVTSIGSEAFYQCYALSSVAIPNSVTYIGSNAFEQSSLQSVTIPNSVTYIGESAFYNCHYLASVTISNSVTNIGNCVFAESGLTSVDIPNSVTSIGSNAFYNCSGLLSVTIPNSVTSIGESAFCRCSGLRSVTIPNSVTSIGESAFMECTSLCSMTIPNSLTSIDCYTFASCYGLKSLTIPSSVTRIGEGAFCYTGLSSIIAESEIPPTLFFNEGYENIYMFEGVDKSTCILYVPIGCKSAYENDWGWNGFQNIVELGEEPNTDISALDNAIYVEQTDGRIGGMMDIPVKLKNSYPVRGFQFNLELPEGTTINGWELSTSRMPEGATLSDMIATKKIEGNKIQVACSLNYGNATFTGNDGEIATVNVTFSEGMEEGTYPIYLTACDLTTSGGIDEDLSDVTSTLVLENYIVGDANGDGKIRIGDATTILNYIVGSASDNFNEKAADANCDGKIRIGDATTILNIIVNQ